MVGWRLAEMMAWTFLLLLLLLLPPPPLDPCIYGCGFISNQQTHHKPILISGSKPINILSLTETYIAHICVGRWMGGFLCGRAQWTAHINMVSSSSQSSSSNAPSLPSCSAYEFVIYFRLRIDLSIALTLPEPVAECGWIATGEWGGDAEPWVGRCVLCVCVCSYSTQNTWHTLIIIHEASIRL